MSCSGNQLMICRRTVLFSGRVQGVGFRYTTEAIAARFDVTGFVRNLPDGRVELVAEGTRDQLNRLQNAVESDMGSYIREVSARDTPATGEYTSFRIAL